MARAPSPMALGSPTSALFNAYCMVAAFATYFCMYAFRKPFTVGVFEGRLDVPGLPDLDYKIALILSQVFGYTLSKFIGIKVISEITAARRAGAILAMIGAAELALLGFALTPRPWNALFLFLNGLPLGMIWGLVFAFLEGRRTTEVLGAALSVSFIVSSGAVKSVGRLILSLGAGEAWMPFLTGLVFALPLLLSVSMLSRIPPPSAEDEAERTRRQPMRGASRRAFFGRFAPGLVCLVVFYMLLTAFRDFRDNFAREIWDAVGHAGESLIFTSSEIPVAGVVLVAIAAVVLIRDNRRAVMAIHGLLIAGSVLVGASTLLFQLGAVGEVTWMVAVGMGLYLGYVPFGCILFDRIIAATGHVGTAGFMIYVADAFGYVGSVALLLFKSLGQPELSWLEFFIPFSYFTSAVCALAFLWSLVYFARRARHA